MPRLDRPRGMPPLFSGGCPPDQPVLAAIAAAMPEGWKYQQVY
jgi:hypothetical protein